MVLAALAAWTAAVGWFFFGPRRRVRARIAGGGAQEVTITVRGGYSPDTVVVERGRPVRLLFDRRETADCSERVVFPDLKLSRRLKALAVTPLEFTPEKTGRFGFACGMNMYRGTLVVREPGA